MKNSGLYVILGIVLWIVANFNAKSYLAHQLHLRTFIVLGIIVFSIIWLSNHSNRQAFKLNFKVPKSHQIPELIKKGFIFTLIIAIWALLTILIEGANIYIKTTPAYKFIEDNIRSDSIVLTQIGEFRNMDVGGSFHTKSGENSLLEASVIVFGSKETIEIDVVAAKKLNRWQMERFRIRD